MCSLLPLWLGTGHKNNHLSLSLEEKAPIVQFYRLESFITVEATYTSPTSAQDHAITLLLLKMSRYSHRVALHLHSIHKFFSVRYDTLFNVDITLSYQLV